MLSIRTCVENNDDVRIKPNGLALIFIVGSKDGTTDNSEVGLTDDTIDGFVDGLTDGW